MTKYCISILPEGGEVPNIVVADSTGLAQFHHRLVVFIHESCIRVVQEVDELRESRKQLLSLLGYLVVELYSVKVEDGVPHLVPDTLLLRVGDEGVLNLVAVGRENTLGRMADKGKLEIVPAQNRVEALVLF